MSSSPDDSSEAHKASEDPHENWEEDVLKQGELPGQNLRLKKAGDLEQRRQELKRVKPLRASMSNVFTKIQDKKTDTLCHVVGI